MSSSDRRVLSIVGRWARRRSTRVVVDLALLASFAIALLTHEPSYDPDYLLHSWAGLSLVPLLAVHLIGHAGWIARVWRNGRRDRHARLSALNAMFAVVTTTCVISGLPLWLDWSSASVVFATHAVTGYIAIATMLAHLVANRRRIGNLARRGAS